jgi:hypothetical protein
MGEVASSNACIVTGTNGENVIHAEAADPLTAWRRACDQAVSGGMQRRDEHCSGKTALRPLQGSGISRW